VTRRGFSFAEVLLALSLLSVCVLGVFSLFRSGLRDALCAEERLAAYHLLADLAEHIRHIERSDLLLLNVDRGRSFLSRWLELRSASMPPDVATQELGRISKTCSAFRCQLEEDPGGTGRLVRIWLSLSLSDESSVNITQLVRITKGRRSE
jgi:prepilin-type N-terminal cleavage/methylation domain-containing protein